VTRAWLLIVALPIGGCAGGQDPWLEPADLDVAIQRSGFAHLGGIGLSGSALDGVGRLWAIPERQRALIKLERDADDVVQVRAVPLDGVPDELDTESLAWLGSDRFAIGTERRLAGRGIDAVLLVRLVGDRARVTGAIPLDYRELFGISAPSNEGIEGLCRAGVHLIAAGEPVVVDAGRRFATVARRRLDRNESWTPYLVQLTTATGKLSALDCWSSDDSMLHVLAVERHYGTTRIVHFGVPDSGGKRAIIARVLANLDSRFERMPNVEGIVREGNRVVLLTDHDSLGQSGATESIRIGPFDTDSDPEEMDEDDD
jgi:hypothetical protein